MNVYEKDLILENKGFNRRNQGCIVIGHPFRSGCAVFHLRVLAILINNFAINFFLLNSDSYSSKFSIL